MRKIFFVLVSLLGLTGSALAQSSQVLIDAGSLQNATGTAAVPVGGLLQLIASPSGNFTAPTSSSYISGDNILLESQAMNYNVGIGETTNLFTLSLSGSPYALTVGEKLLLRFYPSLTLASMPSAPTLGTSYGQVRSDTIEFGPAGGDATETTWVVPASGRADLDYVTVSRGGTYDNSTAYAFGTVGVAVPEPSTTGLLGGLTICLVGLAKRCRRRI